MSSHPDEAHVDIARSSETKGKIFHILATVTSVRIAALITYLLIYIENTLRLRKYKLASNLAFSQKAIVYPISDKRF